LSREELRALSGSLLHAQDEERRRVSRELHDDVSQNVARLKFDLDALEQKLPRSMEGEKQRLLAIRDIAAQLSNDLRRIAYALHPSTLDLLGLTVALSSYAREFSKRTGIPVEFSASGVPAEVPPGIASSFYRIAQEALRNVARHGDGGVAQVSLTGDKSHLTLAIRDNGPGFDRDAVRGQGGLGLVSMEERARLIHASFQLETAPGCGVSITVSAPLEYAN
jgi:signal transduction histidine kinase